MPVASLTENNLKNDTNYSFSLRMKDQTELPVYNYIYEKNNLTWGKYMDLVRKGLHQPLDKALWLVLTTENYSI